MIGDIAIDENSVTKFDDKAKEAVKTLLIDLQCLKEVEQDRKRLRLLIKNGLLKQTMNPPFGVHED